MKKDDLGVFEGKRIRLFLRGNICYTGRILKINDDSVLIRDKFDNEVLISVSDIAQIISIGGDL